MGALWHFQTSSATNGHGLIRSWATSQKKKGMPQPILLFHPTPCMTCSTPHSGTAGWTGSTSPEFSSCSLLCVIGPDLVLVAVVLPALGARSWNGGQPSAQGLFSPCACASLALKQPLQKRGQASGLHRPLSEPSHHSPPILWAGSMWELRIATDQFPMSGADCLWQTVSLVSQPQGRLAGTLMGP